MCVLSRFVTAGNVLDAPLAAVLDGPTWKAIVALVPRRRGETSVCNPDCSPQSDGTDCAPAD